MITISKSSYIRGLQCTKSLFLNLFHKKFGIEPDKQDTKKFDIGHDIGILAQQLFPGGKNYGYNITRDKNKSCSMTKSLIENNKSIIYEAAFEYDGLLCYADFIVKQNNKWNIYEVKSTTSIKEEIIDDASFQYYIITKHIDINDIFIVYINKEYIRKGELEIKKLFTIESVKNKVVPLQEKVRLKSKEFKILNEEETIPDIKIGKHCTTPYDCNFIGNCWKNIPEYSIFDLQNISTEKKFQLYEKGITEIKDIPNNYNLNEKTKIEITSFLENRDYIDKRAINEFMKKITYPLYFMDFESYQSAIPEFNNTRPYQQIPFQYCLLYKESKNSELKQIKDYLDESYSDPRVEFIKSLIKNTSKPGIIIVYNATFEKSILNKLSIDFPEYEMELKNIISRIIDIMEPFRNKIYYKPSMRSSYSLKYVIPSINPIYDYENLEIQDGRESGTEYLRLRSLKDNQLVKEIRKNLIEYCHRDTQAMSVLLEELEKELSNT